MGTMTQHECFLDDPVEAMLIKGSDYVPAYRPGSKIELEVDSTTGAVVVTRGSGAVKVGYLVDPRSRAIASCLRLGYHYSGQIDEVLRVPGGKLLRLRLDPPVH